MGACYTKSGEKCGAHIADECDPPMRYPLNACALCVHGVNGWQMLFCLSTKRYRPGVGIGRAPERVPERDHHVWLLKRIRQHHLRHRDVLKKIKRANSNMKQRLVKINELVQTLSSSASSEEAKVAVFFFVWNCSTLFFFYAVHHLVEQVSLCN